jgi:transposase
MATIDKESLRESFEQHKTEFKKLSRSKKLTPEIIALVNGLLMLMELMLAIFLEKKTKKTNKNSSKPSSQTDKDESNLGNEGSHGKGKNENNATATNTRVKEITSVAKVTLCNICGEDLSKVPSHQCERRTKIDIVFEKVVEHVDAEIKQCPTCDSIVKGQFPADMPGPLQYGSGLKAYIINLLVCQMVAFNRVQKLVKSMIGTLISEASMLKFILRLHEALVSWETAAVAQLLKQPAVHVDETSFRVNKKNQWIHVYSSGDITLKFLHKKRGKEAIEAINIIPRYGGSIIHDCWASYLSYPHCGHGLCGSHLLRELRFIMDSNGYAWAKNMKRLLQEVCKTVSKSKNKVLTQKEYTNLQKRYRNILTRGGKEMPAIPAKPKGKRGKIAKSDAHNLWERLKGHESAVLLFARDPNVAFTNNRAERDLRMSKVKQKVSGCFRVEIYAQAYCRISSYLQTMANKGYNPLIAIQMALAGNIDL